MAIIYLSFHGKHPHPAVSPFILDRLLCALFTISSFALRTNRFDSIVLDYIRVLHIQGFHENSYQMNFLTIRKLILKNFLIVTSKF